MKKVAPYKKKVVADLVKKLQESPIVGLVDMENLPAPQLQRMKSKLRESVEIAMTKKRLMNIAIEKVKESKPGLEKLPGLMTGMPALLFTRENPFKLLNELKKSKTAAPAKAGQTAPKDIIIPPGPTPFAPGPIISELGGIGLKTGVEAGKVAIKQEFTAAKAGEQITAKVADVLSKLGIEPMEVGLNVVAVYENGLIYGRDVLALDQDTFLKMLAGAAADSTALAISIGYTTKDTVPILIAKAFFEAKHIAEVGNISITEGEDQPEEKKEEEPKVEEKAEETKAEEKAEEPKAEEPKEKPEEPKKEEKIKKEEKPQPKIKGKVKTKISEDFKKDVAEEKARREKLDQKAVEDLAHKLRRKGTVREG